MSTIKPLWNPDSWNFLIFSDQQTWLSTLQNIHQESLICPFRCFLVALTKWFDSYISHASWTSSPAPSPSWALVFSSSSTEFPRNFHHEFSFHCSHGGELVTLKLRQLLQTFSFPQNGCQLPISRLVVFHFVSRIHRQACHFCTSCGSLWILKNLTNFASFSKIRRCEDDNRDDSVFRCEIELEKKSF